MSERLDVAPVQQTVRMTMGEDLVEERRRRRRAGDPRLSEFGRELFRRMAIGDLAAEFQAALDADLDSDRLLAGDDRADGGPLTGS